jgi:hypothetical protein
MTSYPIFTHVVDLWEISQYGPAEFYAYQYDLESTDAVPQLEHILDEQGFDACYTTLDEAKAAIEAEIALTQAVAQPTNA